VYPPQASSTTAQEENTPVPKKYKVTLTPEERHSLQQMVRSGKTPARTLTRARVLLKADCSEGRAGWTDEQISEALDVGRATVERIRQRFVEESFETALYSRRPGRRYPHKLDGEAEAHLVALACSSPPGGRARWTIRLLAGRLVELGVVESVSRETVRRVLKKTN
jgi:transposase